MAPQVMGVTPGSPFWPWCCGHSSWRGAQHHPYKFIMIMTSYQIFIIKKKKLHEPFNDFDADEDYDGDNKTYQERVWQTYGQTKGQLYYCIFSIHAGFKSRLFVHLCCMVPMFIICHVLKGDISKLEVNFFNRYREGDHVFYISAIDSKGDFQFVDDEVHAS